MIDSSNVDTPIGEGRYRADVDGLRAVAVLAVILFHLHAGWVPGGFAGVDVFLAISGFLLTRNVLSEIERGTFSVAGFYRRRVKRIALPMLAVVGVVVASAQVLLLPEDALRTVFAGLWSIASLANVWFWRNLDTGYFSREAHEAPLLHLWSLGVEEQFYLAWPLLLPLAARVLGAARALFAAIAALAIASFAGGQALLGSDPRFAFYMLPTRAGGLLLGALAAIAARGWDSGPGGAAIASTQPDASAAKSIGSRTDARRALPEARRAARVRSLAAVVGAALVLGSFARLEEGSPFPGWRAVPPSLGATLILLAGAAGPNPVSALLSWRPLVAVGLVSYSAYLWHWPLVAFHRYAWGEVGPLARGVIALLTAVLAWASWRWIERPARRSTASLGAVFRRQWLLPSAAVVALAAFAIATGGKGPRILSSTYDAELSSLRDRSVLAVHAGIACDRKRLREKDFTDPRCLLGPPDAPTGAVLWGDSQAGHYVGMLEEFARAGGFRFRNFDTYGCAPVDGDPTRFEQADRVEDCVASNRLVLPRLSEYPVVFLAASWPGYTGRPPFLEATLRLAGRLAAEGRRVVLLGKAPSFPNWDRSCRAKAISIPWLRCPTERFQPLASWIAKANARLREFADETPGVSYFDANDLLCADPRGCAAFEDGEALYFDAHHLTLVGSRRTGARVLRERGLPEPFASIASHLRDAGRGRSNDATAGAP